MDLRSKFCKKRELVMDTCSGNPVPAKACFQVPEQGKFVNSKKGSAYFQNALRPHLEV